MEEKIVAKLNRTYGHLYLYHGQDVDMLASYWHVSGLLRDEDGRYMVISEDGRVMGRIMGEAVIKESW